MAERRSSISDEVLSYTHQNNVNIKDRILYSHSYFEVEDWDLDYRQACVFLRNLDFLNSLSHDPITMKIFSPGGCYYSGFTIYDAMRNSKSPIITHSYGIAASMGSIVPQAASKRFISQNASVMIHRMSSYEDGDILKIKASVDFAKKQMDRMYSLYAEKCVDGKFFKSKKMTQGEVAAFIEDKLQKIGDWWMSPEESVYYGFMDGII